MLGKDAPGFFTWVGIGEGVCLALVSGGCEGLILGNLHGSNLATIHAMQGDGVTGVVGNADDVLAADLS